MDKNMMNNSIILKKIAKRNKYEMQYNCYA